MKTYHRNMARRWAFTLHRKHGQFEWVAPVVLFASLLFCLTAPTYLWTIIGM